jgi:hypothetical protein
MTKRNFKTAVYSVPGIGAFLVEFLPVNIVCFSLLSYQGVNIFFKTFNETPGKTKGYHLKKGIFLLLILVLICITLPVFMYRHEFLFLDK